MSTQVEVGLSRTANTGNYENLRIDIKITDTVRDGETANAAVDRVYSLVEAKLNQKLEENGLI